MTAQLLFSLKSLSAVLAAGCVLAACSGGGSDTQAAVKSGEEVPESTDSSGGNSSRSVPNPGAAGSAGAAAAEVAVDDGVDTNLDLTLRPFSPESPWNTPIPTDAAYASQSDPRVAGVRSMGSLNVQGTQWTLPVYYASSSDPVRTIFISALNLPGNNIPFYTNNNRANAREGSIQIRMPASAVPDSGTDAAFIVIDPEGKYAHEFWYAHPNGSGGYNAVSYARVPLDGTGVNISGETTTDLTGSYYNPAYLTYGWGPISAYGGSGLAGLIRKGEITGGEMNHALRMLIPFEKLGWPASGRPIWPATHLERHCTETGPVILGTRFAIPYSVNLSSLGLSAPALTLAKALQKYGAYVVDSTSDAVNLNADSVSAQTDSNLLRQNQADLNKILSLMTVVNPPSGTNTSTLAKPPGC